MVKVAVAKGATILERHVGIETETIKLNKYSINPEQVDEWVRSALAAKEIGGAKDLDKPIGKKRDCGITLPCKRGVYAVRDIEKGETIRREDVFFAMPCADGQVSSGEFGQYRSVWKASKDYPREAPIFEHFQQDTIHDIRNIIHDAKGMLYEAGIELGPQFDIQLSRHYGINKFRETGAILINLVNRQYCKKLVIVLPGQRHPNHRHAVKEETFQLLWGELELNLNGQIVNMKPGDMLLIEPEVWHSFLTRSGAIFGGYSTTHIKGNSYYEDPAIKSADPMERKTVLRRFVHH